MAYWKTEDSFAPRLTLRTPERHLELAALVLIAAIPALLIVWLVPSPIVLPALSIGAFVMACVLALFAYYSGVDLHAPGATLWDIAALFTLIWIGAGMVGGPRHFVELFERLATS
jgi:hypothetical protein